MGLDGKQFTIYKLRSMYEDAEAETGPVWARDDDPRCTPVGRLLAQDEHRELPQLWNVLRGDMSLVGPRPSGRTSSISSSSESRSTCCATR
jgi:lipopolysaccharide/colanic/teichoic acid biosynthesis glycosyltransferase